MFNEGIQRPPMSKGEKRFTVLALVVLIAAMIFIAVYRLEYP